MGIRKEKTSYSRTGRVTGDGKEMVLPTDQRVVDGIDNVANPQIRYSFPVVADTARDQHLTNETSAAAVRLCNLNVLNASREIPAYTDSHVPANRTN